MLNCLPDAITKHSRNREVHFSIPRMLYNCIIVFLVAIMLVLYEMGLIMRYVIYCLILHVLYTKKPAVMVSTVKTA